MSTSQPLLPQHALIGGKYRLGPVIGSGGVGTVYRATHLWTEREVAVKVLDPSLPHFDELREAFLREARAAVRLEHTNVVDVLDMGEDDAGTSYLVMELLDGPLLRDVLHEKGRLSADDTLALLLPLMDALETAHELGIAHLDFKPENIILSIDPFGVVTPKLLDFGVAQITREARPSGSPGSSGVIVGTPQYMSPEQARDQRHLIGAQTDVWGVGVVWYECLTGRPPFDGNTPLEILTAVCEEPIDFEEIPDDHVPILREALRRSILERTRNLSELKAQLGSRGLAAAPAARNVAFLSSWAPAQERPSYVRRTLSGVGPASDSSTGPRRVQVDSEPLTLPSTSHWKVALGGAALVVAVGLAAWWSIGGTTEQPPRPPKAPDVLAEPAGDPALTRPEATAAEPEAREPEEASGDPDSLEAVSSPQPGSATTKTSRRRSKRSTARDRRSPSPSRNYKKPPDLVTKW